MKCKFHWPTIITHLVVCNKKITIFLNFQNFYDQKQKAHIMLNEQNALAIHDSALLKYRGYTKKKYQFLN